MDIFQIHQKLVHDQRQPMTEKEPDNCDQTTDDIVNKIVKLPRKKIWRLPQLLN